MDKKKIIAIDGPAGSGKSTVSRMVAKRLGILYLDTGAMYRALTLKSMREGVDLSNEKALVEVAKKARIGLKDEGSTKVFLDNEDVSLAIRTPEVTNAIKHVAKVPGVRAEMVAQQRKIGSQFSSVLEGRDIGTVVFPSADYKFYLDASVDERARRRHKELIASGQSVDLETIKKDVISRDESDMNRSVGALKKADDAILIDTTNLSIAEVVDRILSYIKF